MDPLTEADALICAPLVEVVFDSLNMRLGLLFDLRVAEQLRMANTGLIVLRGVECFMWRAERRTTSRTSWNVDASMPSNRDGILDLRLLFSPSAELTVTARSAAFFAGDVPGLPDAPPDFSGNDNKEINSGMASMDSLFEPIQATYFESLA
jgi:hypothetical protein